MIAEHRIAGIIYEVQVALII